MAKVTIHLAKPTIEVAHADCEIAVGGIGKLKFSMGSVEWITSPKSKHQRSYTWKQFAALLESEGKAAVVKKAAVKKIAKPLVATVQEKRA